MVAIKERGNENDQGASQYVWQRESSEEAQVEQ